MMSFLREMNPKHGRVLTTITVALLTVGAYRFFPFELILIGVVVAAFIGCINSTLPLIEYMVATAVSFAIAMVIPIEPWILVLPGLVAGYIWGSIVADRLDKQNFERLRAGTKEMMNRKSL